MTRSKVTMELLPQRGVSQPGQDVLDDLQREHASRHSKDASRPQVGVRMRHAGRVERHFDLTNPVESGAARKGLFNSLRRASNRLWRFSSVAASTSDT